MIVHSEADRKSRVGMNEAQCALPKFCARRISKTIFHNRTFTITATSRAAIPVEHAISCSASKFDLPAEETCHPYG